MLEVLDLVFIRTWWTWSPDSNQWFDWLYHWFNIAEGCAWIGFAFAVLRRHIQHRHSRVECAYAVAFLAFATSDFAEAWQQSSWLIWLKLVNLVALLWLRRIVMTRFYPGARIF